MQRRLLEGPFQRLKKHAAKLIAATLFLAGAGTGLYYVTGVDSGPVGAVIVAPADNSTHTTDADGCANGFTTDVVVRTSAPDGTDAVLTADGLRVAEASVSGGAVTFPSVMLGTRGKHVLVAQVADARAVSTLTVACEGHPTCRMLGPTWAPDTPGLNGNPRGYDAGADSEADPWVTWTSQGGDRTSSAGSPYQYRIDLLTGVGAGSVVEVYVDGSKTGIAPRPTGGTQMQIHGVPIGSDDGDHSVYLRCVGTDGSVGFSTRALVSADTKPPQLTTLTPKSDDRMTVADGKMRVCVSSTSADALGLSAKLGEAKSNLCVAVGTSTPTCVAMTTGGAAPYWTARDAAVPDTTSLCDGAVSCTCDTPCPSRHECTVNSLTGCETLEKVEACRDGQDGGYDPLSQTEICTSEEGTFFYGSADEGSEAAVLSTGGCPEGTSVVPVGEPFVDTAGYCRATYECQGPGATVHDRVGIMKSVAGTVNPQWAVGPYTGDPLCLRCNTTWICPYSYTAERDGGCLTRHVTRVDGTTKDVNKCDRSYRCAPAGCDGCPTGTTVTPGTKTAYSCVQADGGVVHRKAIPCLSDAGVTWDAGCYACVVAGDAAGSGCVAEHEVQVDGGCRACEYQLDDGGTSTTPWQCPQCVDNAQTPNGACVEVECPGPAPFDLRVSVYDGVRNATTRTIQGVSCAGATGPSVEIIDPIGGSRLEVMADLAKRVLVNAGPRRDENLAAPGAQYTVIACTNAPLGSSATLHAGKAGETLAQVATTTVVAADAGASACPLHRPYAARLAGATLPDSWVDGLGRLKTATRLRVDVDGADAGVGASPVVDLWVDSTLPEVAIDDPLCGTTLPEAGTYPLRIRSSALPVTVTVTNSQGTQTYMGLSAEPEM
jgi:hypothetical protein